MTPKGQRIRRRRGSQPARRRFGDRVKSAARMAAIGGAIMLLLVGVAYGGLRGYAFAQESEFFRLRSIEIDGVSHSVEAEMRALMEDIKVGERTLFNVSPRVIEARLEQHPRLEPSMLSVARGWPDRLVIEAAERIPVAMVAGSRLMLINADGWVIEQSPDRVLEQPLPVLSGIEGSALVYGRRVESQDADRLLEWLLAMRHHLPRVHRQISELHIDDMGEVTAHLIGGAQIHLGARPPQERMPVLLAFVRENEREVGEDLRGIAMLDLRMAEHLVYRPAGG